MKRGIIKEYRTNILKQIKIDIFSLLFLSVMLFILIMYLTISSSPLVILGIMYILTALTLIIIIKGLYNKIYSLQEYDDFLVWQNENLQKKKK